MISPLPPLALESSASLLGWPPSPSSRWRSVCCGSVASGGKANTRSKRAMAMRRRKTRRGVDRRGKSVPWKSNPTASNTSLDSLFTNFGEAQLHFKTLSRAEEGGGGSLWDSYLRKGMLITSMRFLQTF